MKKTFSFLTVLVLVTAVSGTVTGLHAQTNTNSFVIPLGTNVTFQPVIAASSVTIQSVSFNFVVKRADIFVSVSGLTKHYVIQGAAFAAMVANFQSQYGTPFATYLQAHPPTQ